MDRMTCRITDDNRRRLEILKAFGTGSPTLQDIVNRSIEEFFASVCTTKRVRDESLKEIMEELLPQECRRSLKSRIRSGSDVPVRRR